MVSHYSLILAMAAHHFQLPALSDQDPVLSVFFAVVS